MDLEEQNGDSVMKIDHLAYIMADKADIAKLLRLEDEGGIEKAAAEIARCLS